MRKLRIGQLNGPSAVLDKNLQRNVSDQCIHGQHCDEKADTAHG